MVKRKIICVTDRDNKRLQYLRKSLGWNYSMICREGVRGLYNKIKKQERG